MGVPLAGQFDVAVPEPIDSRSVWSGSNLNSLPNRYTGIITYANQDRNLYVDTRRNAFNSWERVVTTTVNSNNPTGSFVFSPNVNGQVLNVSGDSTITGFLPTNALGMASGYNVTVIQIGDGNIVFNDSNILKFRNRLALNRTAGKYSVASILRIGNTNEFLLYGDLI